VFKCYLELLSGREIGIIRFFLEVEIFPPWLKIINVDRIAVIVPEIAPVVSAVEYHVTHAFSGTIPFENTFPAVCMGDFVAMREFVFVHGY